MSFWNFIGVSSKKDISDINKQLEDMRRLIGINICSSDNLNTINNKIKENISQGFSSIKNEINNLNLEFNEKTVDFKNTNIKNQELINDVLEKIKYQIAESNETNKKQLIDINRELLEVRQDIKAMKTTIATKEDIADSVKDIKNNINSLNIEFNKEISGFKSDSIKGQQVICDILEKIDGEILKLNEKNKTQINDLNTIIKTRCNDIKESQAQIDMLNKELSIIQQMIRVVWVNDIVDTLENEVSKAK